MNKKGQSLSINTIIIAIIAITVLVVLVMIFTGAMGEWVKKLGLIKNQYCGDVPTGKTGKSVSGTKTLGSCSEDVSQVYGSFEDVPQGYVCCEKKS